jgi:hypothetical protein
LTFVRDHKPKLRENLMREKKLTDSILADLKAALNEFKGRFRTMTAKEPALAGASA